MVCYADIDHSLLKEIPCPLHDSELILSHAKTYNVLLKTWLLVSCYLGICYLGISILCTRCTWRKYASFGTTTFPVCRIWKWKSFGRRPQRLIVQPVPGSG